ncbi:MAG: hypothetical protein ACYS0C_04690 [Planctomycetota bacterium]
MIKTLRITSVIVVVLAVVFFAFPAVFGFRSDEQAEQFLNSASVIEKFSKVKGKKSAKTESQISPLVKQAEAFALYLNPPKPKKPPATSTRKMAKPSITPRPAGPVSSKFNLIGTSYYASHPDLSLALIDEPAKGLRWVRQSTAVGHLIIELVKDGSVVVRDGKRTFEIPAERAKKRSLLKDPLSGTTGSRSIPPTLAKAGARITSRSSPQTDAKKRKARAAGKADSRITSSRPPKTNAQENAASASGKAGASTTRDPLQMSPEERQAFIKEQEALAEKIFAELEAMQADIKPNQTDLEMELNTAARENLISSLEAIRISAEEAKKLDRLGEKLKDIQQDPNRAKEDRTVSDPNSSEPNLSEPNFSEPNSTEEE